ncbi:MAG: hypothetical protein ABL309_11605 [Phycisphaerales bacterium]
MRQQKKDIKACVRHWLAQQADHVLSPHGFGRRANSLIYSRRSPDGSQRIAIHLEFSPIDDRNAVAAVYPMFRIVVDQANELVREMVSGRSELIGELRSSLSGPIAWTSPDKPRARWYVYQPDSVPGAVQEIAEFLTSWTVPYIDRYCTVDGLAAAAAAATQGTYPYRAAKTQQEKLCVIAAKLLIGQREDARDLLEQSFGKPAQRRHFQPVFEYFDALLS